MFEWTNFISATFRGESYCHNELCDWCFYLKQGTPDRRCSEIPKRPAGSVLLSLPLCSPHSQSIKHTRRHRMGSKHEHFCYFPSADLHTINNAAIWSGLSVKVWTLSPLSQYIDKVSLVLGSRQRFRGMKTPTMLLSLFAWGCSPPALPHSHGHVWNPLYYTEEDMKQMTPFMAKTIIHLLFGVIRKW